MDSQSIIQQAERFFSYWQQDPQNKDLYIQTLDSLLQAGQFDRMEQLLIQPPVELASSPELDHWLGMHELATGQFHAAEERYLMMANNYPDLTGPKENLAQAQALLQKYADAIQTLKTIPEKMLSIEGMQTMLRAYYWLGDLDSVIKMAVNWLQGMHPDDYRTAGLLSMALIDVNQLDNAVPWAQHALSYGPNSDAFTTMGMFNLAHQQPDQSKHYFMQSTQLDPRNGRSWLGLGMCAMACGDMDAALPFLLKAAEYLPGYIGTWHMLAWYEIAKMQYNQAEKHLHTAMDLNHNFADNHAALAIVDILRGDLDKADRKIEVALKLDSESTTAQYAKAILLNASGQANKANEIFKSILTNPRPIGLNLVETTANFKRLHELRTKPSSK